MNYRYIRSAPLRSYLTTGMEAMMENAMYLSVNLMRKIVCGLKQNIKAHMWKGNPTYIFIIILQRVVSVYWGLTACFFFYKFKIQSHLDSFSWSRVAPSTCHCCDIAVSSVFFLASWVMEWYSWCEGVCQWPHHFPESLAMTDTHLWTRLLHSLSLVAVGMSVAHMRHGLQLAGMGWVWLSHNGLWAYVACGKRFCFVFVLSV